MSINEKGKGKIMFSFGFLKKMVYGELLGFYVFLPLYWGYIVIFTQVLTVYHSLIHPLHHSPLFPCPNPWNSFNRCHFSTYIHTYTVFAPYLPSYTLSPQLLFWFSQSDKHSLLSQSSVDPSLFLRRTYCRNCWLFLKYFLL
jgi:hypothetical protein